MFFHTKLKPRFCRFNGQAFSSCWLAVILIFTSTYSARCDVVLYQLQSSSSQLNFSGTQIKVASGLGFLDFAITAQPGGSLASALTGVFSAEVGSPILNTGGALIQLSDILGDIRNPLNADVGDIKILGSSPLEMKIENIAAPLPFSYLQGTSGLVSFDINSPPLVGSGGYPLNSAVFNISNIQYGTQGTARTASFDFSATGLLATSVPGVFLDANVTGTVLGIEAVPEPSSAVLAAFISMGLLIQRRRIPD